MVFNVLLLPARLLFGTAKLSAKAGYKTAKTGAVAGARTAKGSAKAGFAAGRVVGYGRTAVFASGIAVGVLIASPKARSAVGSAASSLWELRVKLSGPTDEEIADQIRRRLAGAQSTWHLTQPRVTVQEGIVRLDGSAPDLGARQILAETASEVGGVREVDNRVVVDESKGGSGRAPAAAQPSP